MGSRISFQLQEASYIKKGQFKIHYAWIIFLGCCLLQGGSVGIIMNCSGLNIAHLTRSCGFSIGQFSYTRVFAGLATCFIIPIVARLRRTHTIREVLSISASVYAGTVVLMSTFTELWHWIIGSTIQRMAGAFLLFLPILILVNNWVKEKIATIFFVTILPLYAVMVPLIIRYLWPETAFAPEFAFSITDHQFVGAIPGPLLSEIYDLHSSFENLQVMSFLYLIMGFAVVWVPWKLDKSEDGKPVI